MRRPTERRVTCDELVRALVRRAALEATGGLAPPIVLCQWCGAPVEVIDRRRRPPRYCRPRARCQYEVDRDRMLRGALLGRARRAGGPS